MNSTSDKCAVLEVEIAPCHKFEEGEKYSDERLETLRRLGISIARLKYKAEGCSSPIHTLRLPWKALSHGVAIAPYGRNDRGN